MKAAPHTATSTQALRAPVLLIMAGGTGGHVFPGLAVADLLRMQGWRVLWLGRASGMEATLVPQQGIPITFINFGGVRGKSWLTKLLLPFNLLRACWQSLRVMWRVRPDVVLGLGGYLTFPGSIIAVLLRWPLVLHEQNSIAGLANRILAKVAHRILVAFPDALPRGYWVGNPVRADFFRLAAPAKRYSERSGALRLLVIGGSLGAAALNELVPKALALLPIEARLEVTHQTGIKHIDSVRAYYAAAGVTVKAVPFIDDMAQAYGAADLVICRAGAMTVAEVAAVGVAALFVPFPYAVDDHQTHNARFLSDQEAAMLIAQHALTKERLADWLGTATRASLVQMAVRARALAKPDAAEQVARACKAALKD